MDTGIPTGEMAMTPDIREPTGRTLLAFAAMTVLTLALHGCYAKYSPPIRALDYGSPGRVEKGQMRASVSWLPLQGGSATVEVAPSDFVSVEAGADLIYDVVGTASLGLRIDPWPASRQNPKYQFLSDVELGFGLGVGGDFICDEDEACVTDDVDWSKRFAYGGYIGTGIGLGFTYWRDKKRVLDVDLYGRVRMTFSDARGAPYTTWVIWGPGIQIRIHRFFRLWYMYPFSYHWNDYERELIYLYGEIGFGFEFDILGS